MVSGDFFELTTERDSVLSIGVFDGVHLGHQHLLRQVVARARQAGRLSVAVTFNPRPREVLRPNLPSEYVITLDERIRLIGELGFDCVPVLEFTREVAATPAEKFVRTLRRRYRMAELWVGPDFALGRGRGGTIPVLRELGAELGFTVGVVEPFELDGEIVSSTLIHQKLAEGDVAAAGRLLGRLPAATGEVVAGAGRGRTLGVPTANVGVPDRLALPANGVYAVCCRFVGKPAGRVTYGWSRPQPSGNGAPRASLLGVANVGTRPTFDNGRRTLEVHLLDFSADVYGAQLRVEFVQRLRPERRFPSAEALLDQIRRDIGAARAVLGCR